MFTREMKEEKEKKNFLNMKQSPKTSKPAFNMKNLNVEIATARFTFKNGDSYEGKYRVNVDRRTLVRQDQGIYTTDNFDVYDGKWYDDKFGSGEFHIRYNNNAQYKGNLDANGMMNGKGTYFFPDGSLLTAIWSGNKLVSDIIYRELLGYEWTTTSISNTHVTFATANQFWNEVYKDCKVYSEGNFSSSI
ncbi:uncharacterized protein LOC105835377 [Monomorium pharaonis]|uniref:uncharacterized protein LOC105835377 n=1 Tax=Monomorium pharaonis TaxID=307658 RepID=UPI00063F9D90|nr:uncharacterized protein LOC105835377 [Monomorium pharaonis]